MKQIFQSLRSGEVTLEEVPMPTPGQGCLVIQTERSLISLGTERMLLEFGKAGWLEKARQQPDKVKQVIDKIKTDGIAPTIKAVFSKLEQAIPLGYSNVGIILEVGRGVTQFKKGDRVASNGPHAEIVSVPQNLCALVPENVDSTTASFTVVSSIALQGVRLAQPTLGESIAVVGLGLIGLITCQILKANGCKVIGFDFDQKKVALAATYGVQAVTLTEEIDPVQIALSFSKGQGVDAVIITATTKSNSPIEQAPRMCRKRGRVILVGVSGLTLNRTDFYQKEISFQVSCSYGPGRYEKGYEQESLDYPLGFVRWTAQRNFEAVLQLMAEGKLKVDELVSEVVPFNQVQDIYQKRMSEASALGFVIDYPNQISYERTIVRNYLTDRTPRKEKEVVAALIGAGNYASATLLPILSKSNIRIQGIAARSAVNINHLAKKYKIPICSTDYHQLLENKDINTIFILTRHDSHCRLAIEALDAGKHVFVEKPPTINEEELNLLTEAVNRHPDLHFMVGFNRRFAPLTVKLKSLLAGRQSALAMTMLVNAGSIPADHWVHDPIQGGGRIIGEACHFIDLLMHIAESPITSVHATRIGNSADQICEDKCSISLSFADGSIGTVHYFANGHRGFPKERLTVFSDGRVLELDNFKELRGYGFKAFSKMVCKEQDKGHREEIAHFGAKLFSGHRLKIPIKEIENVMYAASKTDQRIHSDTNDTTMR